MPLREITATIPKDFHDAFGRLRTSETGQRLDVEFIYDKQPSFVDEVTNNGSVTFNPTSRDLTLGVDNATAGSYALMRTHPVPYTPGNSQLVEITGVLDFAEIGGGVAQVFLRSNVTGSIVETVEDQANWSEDGVADADWTKSHIFGFDFQSLKVGTIRYMMVRDGVPTVAHILHNDNRINTGYWQLPSLPAYWRVYNSGAYTYMEMGYGDENNAIGFRYRIAANASATMKAICCTVKSEGGDGLREMPGVPFSADRGVTLKTVAATLIPLISIHPKDLFNTLPNLGLALPKSYSLQLDNPIRLVVIVGGTLTGAVWDDVDPTSIVEMDTSATAIANGRVVHSEYLGTAKNTQAMGQGILGKEVLWNRLGSETGILTIAAVRTTGTSADCLASVKWEEIR